MANSALARLTQTRDAEGRLVTFGISNISKETIMVKLLRPDDTVIAKIGLNPGMSWSAPAGDEITGEVLLEAQLFNLAEPSTARAAFEGGG